MANSTLHAIAIEELRYSNPQFHEEYCKLVEGISNQILELANQYPNEFDFTSFTETYDRASNESVLQIAIGHEKNELYVHIYIHKDNYFLVGKSGAGKEAKTAEQALELVKQSLIIT